MATMHCARRFLDDENRCQGEEQTEHSHGDEQNAQLAIIRWHRKGAGRLIPNLTGDEEDLVQVFGAERARGQRQVGEGCHHGEEGGF